MKFSKDSLMELGKFFINLALAVIVALIIHPIANKKVDVINLFIGITTAAVSLITGFTIIILSDRFK
ncbi:MAG: hypothetical protein DSY42_08860 [Aquifex sp.]|nr:MAG: hypothetical protein DSY42_08860 [Aquifex sp.]